MEKNLYSKKHFYGLSMSDATAGVRSQFMPINKSI
jgi:hypothetical protein